MRQKVLFSVFILVGLVSCCLTGCKEKISTASSAFYYWKTTFLLDKPQSALLNDAAGNQLYLRLFDVIWDEQKQDVRPNAIVSINQDIHQFKVIPVIYITNRTFEKLTPQQTVPLAKKINQLINDITGQNKISYQAVQIDCDWSTGTRNRYFAFLKAFKELNKKQLEATIRLHQIKYADRTGVPPVDKGLLMFYNMGKISAGLKQRNSIYNTTDAAKYVRYLPLYQLPLDVALPLFSWAIQIREGKVIQIYGKIGQKELSDTANFQQTGQSNIYKAKRSFYLSGIYIKENDLFKLETVNRKLLEKAADQLSKHLAHLEKRNIIYYELSASVASELEAKDIKEISAHF
ncbi:hypothetical protein TH53_18470 [Pedobacter lusitanus]|uniref:Contig80, whole genome shotgun sequence n=1 Tax=Pedobacter lusitanus TaxID=1503925 RepID=A0A0D0FTY6_9SPHI|nr:hypothetical protein [Pedobacter lusitanus]KIO75869.1 hypothetical protein TH53_18470 [Pedobacter lusitanus]